MPSSVKLNCELKNLSTQKPACTLSPHTRIELAAMTTGEFPAVGQIAPDFELSDSTAAPQRLSLIASQGPVVLLFYRGYW